MIRFNLLSLLSLLLALVLLAGCGGGGGGGGTGGTGADPIEVEVGTVLDGFTTALQSQNLTSSLEFVDSNLQYRRLGSTNVLAYNEFQTVLQTFLAGVSSVSVTLTDRGITGDDDAAIVRARLSYSYLDAGNTPRTYSEDCELVLEKVSKWGIRSLSGYNLDGLRFPPAP